MAVIGHAEVIVTPITKSFEALLRRDLKNIQGAISSSRGAGSSLGEAFAQGFGDTTGNVFQKLAGGLENVGGEATAAKDRFQSLVRTGYVVQGVLGLLVGGISSVVVSLGTLVGVLGKAAPAVGVLANAFVTLRVAMATAKFGFGDIASAVQQATQPTNAFGKSIAELREEFQQLLFEAEEATNSEARAALNLEDALNNLKRVQDLPPNSRARREALLAYQEAELAYKRAKDRAADLNEEVGKGQDAYIEKNRQAGGTDPFAQLNEAQREFAEYLVTLKPLIDDLELRVSRALLPPLKDAVEILRTELLPILQTRLPQVAGQVGKAMEEIAAGLDYEMIDRIFAGMTEPFEEGGRSNLQLFGDLLGNILDIFLQITEATGPLLNDFLTFLVEKTQSWSDSMRDSDLVGFFEEAGKYAADLGEILGNIWDGFMNLIGLTTGPGSAGEDMLSWMKDSTETFANMFSEDPKAGKQFFKDAFANAESVLGAIGDFIMEILKIADNPAIKTAFDSLGESAPAFGEMLGKMVDAGPSFANLISTFIEIGNLLTDSNQISSFFDTLNTGAKGFKDFLETKAAQTFLDNLGPIFATLSAVGVIFDVIKFALLTIGGYLLFIQIPMMKIFGKGGPFYQFGQLVLKGNLFAAFRSGFGAVLNILRGPAGIVGLIILLITKAVEFYNKFADFRNMVDSTIGAVQESFGRLFESMSGVFDQLFGEGDTSLMSYLDPIIKFFLELLIPAIGGTITWLVNRLTFIFDFLGTTLGVILEGIVPMFIEIGNFLDALFNGDWQRIFDSLGMIVRLAFTSVFQFITNGFVDVANLVIRQINDMVTAISNSAFGDFLRDVLGINLSGMKIGELAKVDWLGDIAAERNNNALRDSTNSFGGADRRAFNSMTTTNATNYATSAISGMPEYAQYAAGNKIEINVNGSNMDPHEVARATERVLARNLQRGVA